MSLLLMWDQADRMLVQEALPGFMFSLLFKSLRAKGYEVRADLEELADKSSGATIAAAPLDKQSRLAKIVQDDGHKVLKDSGVNEITHLIGGLSRCLVKMQDQGRPVNVDGLAIALGICAEIDDGVEDWGKTRHLNTTMVKLENELVRHGYFKVVEAE